MCDRCSEREGSTSALLMRLALPPAWFLSAISLLLLLFPFLDLPIFKRPRCMFKSEKKTLLGQIFTGSWNFFHAIRSIGSQENYKAIEKLSYLFTPVLSLGAVDSLKPCAAHNQKSPSKKIIIITFCSNKYSQPAPNFNSITWIFVFKDAKSYFRPYIKHSKDVFLSDRDWQIQGVESSRQLV